METRAPHVLVARQLCAISRPSSNHDLSSNSRVIIFGCLEIVAVLFVRQVCLRRERRFRDVDWGIISRLKWESCRKWVAMHDATPQYFRDTLAPTRRRQQRRTVFFRLDREPSNPKFAYHIQALHPADLGAPKTRLSKSSSCERLFAKTALPRQQQLIF